MERRKPALVVWIDEHEREYGGVYSRDSSQRIRLA
jgi:hypothetical protein